MTNPITVTCLYDCTPEKVWNALSQEAELKNWYFPVRDYQFEEGKEFFFYESEETQHFLHKCRFLTIVSKQRIEYSWAHPSHSKGSSVVQWEVQAEGEKTRVTLTHTGVENFADAGNDFSRANFEMGWEAIVKNGLRNYLYGIQKLVFDADIVAPATRVWQILWGRESYSLWTEPFCAGTYYLGEIKQGARVHLLSPTGEGMYSDIAFYKENELLIFKHLGWMKEKKELPLDAETEKWTGIFETYRLSEKEGTTRLCVELDTTKEYFDYMKKTFPLALARLKEMCEY